MRKFPARWPNWSELHLSNLANSFRDLDPGLTTKRILQNKMCQIMFLPVLYLELRVSLQSFYMSCADSAMSRVVRLLAFE